MCRNELGFSSNVDQKKILGLIEIMEEDCCTDPKQYQDFTGDFVSMHS